MTQEDKQIYINQLIKTQKVKDKEIAHYSGVRILCNLLVGLGYKEIVDEYNKI